MAWKKIPFLLRFVHFLKLLEVRSPSKPRQDAEPRPDSPHADTKLDVLPHHVVVKDAAIPPPPDLAYDAMRLHVTVDTIYGTETKCVSS